MTGREILLRALRNEPTPRPAWVPFVGVHGGKLIGVSATEYLKSSERIIQGLTRAYELYQPDGLPVVFDLQVEAEVLGCALRWADETPPAVHMHPLSRRTTADLPPFEPFKGRYPVIIKALETLKQRLGNELAIYGLITGPFTLALHLLGTNMFLQMYDSPQQVRQVLAFCTGICRKAASVYIEHGADVIAVVDPMTSQISPAHFEDLVKPHADEVFAHIRSQGACSSFFVCGNATRNLEKMYQTPCDNVSIDENVPLDYARELATKTGKSLGGNLKLTTVLLLGTEADAKRDAIRCIDAGGPRGFILAPGCDLPYATPPENLQAVAAVVHDEYQRQVARTAGLAEPHESFDDILLPDYDEHDKVIVDVVTLDSASCAPCQYMVKAVEDAAARLSDKVEVREHKITTRSGLGHMAKLGVGQIPTICIDGKVAFPSIIPDITTLIATLEAKVKEKTGK